MAIKEQAISPELERRPNIGVGLLIINRQGQIWTNVEQQSKQNTARNVGDISIPTEQAKSNEGFWGNVKGGLGEFCSDKDMPDLSGNLFVVGSPKVVEVNSDNWQVACNLVTVVCEVNINPTPATGEVAPHGWMNIEEALKLPNLRSFSRQLLEVVKRENLIGRALKQKNGRLPVLDEFGNKSFDRFIQERDLLLDEFERRNEALSLSPKTVLLGEPHGLCAGVVRSIDAYQKAIDMVRAKDPQAEIHSLGEPAHNTFVNSGFREQGVIFIKDLNQAPEGSTVLLGAHGTAPNVRKEAENLGQRLIDTVCPLVTKTHTEAIRYQKEGFQIVYFGKKEHQEAEALLGESQGEGNIILVEKLEDIQGIENKIKDPKKVAFLSQTTHPASKAEEIRQALQKQFPDLKYPSHTDTCYATQNRQDAVRDMIRNGAQVVVVVGSRTSSNSHELQRVAIEEGAIGIFVDSVSELRREQFAGIEVVGLTSGASVLEKTFLEVAQWFRKNGATDLVPVMVADESNINFGPVKM